SAVKSRWAGEWGGWGRFSNDGPGQQNPDLSEGPWGGGRPTLQGGASAGQRPGSVRDNRFDAEVHEGRRQTGRQQAPAGSRLKPLASGKAPPDRPAFQPYWGKPAVRNERGDRGNVGIIRSPVRASILPDHERVHRGAYRALPARRGFIPKADGSQRPLAIAALEDKIVQRATAAVLNAIYEEDFLGFSYGFRPGRGAHDALDALAVGITRTKVSHILDADIRSFFDAVSQKWLLRFLNHRIGDPRILRLIRKWLNAGVLEDGAVSVGETGTGQGSVISPLLANVYLHYVFDLWAERWRRREARGDMIIVRYADDVRHITRRWIPFAERRGLEDMTPGPTAYPAAKVKGDRSMPSKRERSEDADDPVPQGPRDTVRTELFEPQPPTMQAYIPRHSVL